MPLFDRLYNETLYTTYLVLAAMLLLRDQSCLDDCVIPVEKDLYSSGMDLSVG